MTRTEFEALVESAFKRLPRPFKAKMTNIAVVVEDWADPETLRPDDRICYAINRMHAGGFRSLPLVDGEHRPIGIITVNDVVRWLAEIFPEAVLNLRPGDRLKNPAQIDAG